MNAKNFLAAGTAVVIGWSALSGAQAQQTAPRGDPGTVRQQPGETEPREGIRERVREGLEGGKGKSVAPVNRSSNLIGMEVNNHQGERLGDIRDVVVDLQSGRIAYLVIGHGGFLGIGEKLLPVPPQAFTPAEDQKSLILQADRQGVEAAPGVPQGEWPDPRNPAWGAQNVFWQGEAPGVEPKLERPARPGERELEGRLEQDRELRLERAPVPDQQRAEIGQEGMSFVGEMVAFNPAEGILRVQRGAEIREFQLTGDSLVTAGGRPAEIGELEAGRTVTVGYRVDEEGNLVAESISTDAAGDQPRSQ